MQSYTTLLDRVRQMIEEALARHRTPATRVDGQLQMSNMPAGTATELAGGGGSIIPGTHVHSAPDIFAALQVALVAGENIAFTVGTSTITIRATGGAGGYGIVTTSAGDVVTITGGEIVTA